MALARVQATPKATASASSSVAATFSSNPTVGNGVVVCVNFWRPSPFTAIPSACVDNYSNAYTLVASQANGVAVTGIFYCPAITATGASFTVTASCAPSAAAYWVAIAVEVSGVGAGLTVDQSAVAASNSAAPSVGPTAALTASEVFQAGIHAIPAAQGSITVVSATPAWTQEFEELPFTYIAGEANTRIVTSASGTTPSISWTDTSISTWAAVIVAFAASTTPITGTLSTTLGALTLAAAGSAGLTGTAAITLGALTLAASGTVEDPAPLSLTQTPVEVVAPEVPALGRLSQIALDVLVDAEASARLAHVPLELVAEADATLRLSQAIVEILYPATPPAPTYGGTPGIAWIEWQAREPEAVTREDVRTTRAYSDWDLQDPPAYYHGFKAARVESYGQATRTLSDARTGDWQGSTCAIRLSDVDRAMRTALAETPQRFGIDALVIVRMVSRQTRAALGEALTVFAGPIRRAAPAPPLSFDLLLEDAIGHGMLSDALLIPQRVIDASDWEDVVGIENAAGHPVPIIYGVHARPTGAVAPIYLGVEDGQHVWMVAGHYAAVTGVFLDGAPVVDGPDWTLPGGTGPLVEEIAGKRYTLLRGRVGTPPTPTDPVLYAENAGTAGDYFESWIVGRFVGIGFDPTDSHWDANDASDPHAGSVALAGVDLREGDAALGWFGRTAALEDPLQRGYWVNDYTALRFYLKNGTAGWLDAVLDIRFMYGTPYETVLEAGIVVTLEDGLYGLDTSDVTTWQEITIPIEDFEVPTTAPPDRLYIIKDGDEEISLLIDDIALIGGDDDPGEVTQADEAADGTKPLTINVTGWTTTGDALGDVITDLYDQYQHFLITYVANPAGYLTGGPLDNPESDLFDRVVNVIDESSFAIASAQAGARYPPNGYIGRGVLGATPGDRLSVRQWIARWNLSADCRLGVSRYGEIFIVLCDPTAADLEAAVLVDEVNDILEGTFAIDVRWEDQATRVPYRADFHYATGDWLAVGRDADDNTLSAIYGRPAGIEGPTKDYWFVPDSDQGKNVAEHEVARVGHPPRVLEFETPLQLATAGLGGYLRVRHFAGVEPSAIVLVQIEELTVAPGPRRVRVRGVDVTGLIPPPEPVTSSARVGYGRVGILRIGAP